jgi:hypothetical protein
VTVPASTPMPVSPDAFNDADIDAWIKTTRHKVMYRDESRVD